MNGSLSGIQSVRFESLECDQRSLERGRRPSAPSPGESCPPHRDQRRRISQVRNLGLGHELVITVTIARGGKATFALPRHAGRCESVAVAMYRACVKSISESPPPRYSKWPGMYSVRLTTVDANSGGFRHGFFRTEPFRLIHLAVGERAGRRIPSCAKQSRRRIRIGRYRKASQDSRSRQLRGAVRPDLRSGRDASNTI